MSKKLLPLLALLIAVLSFWFIKSKQRGRISDRVTVRGVTEGYRALREGNKTLEFSKHARCRMACRSIDEKEVSDILANGTVNFSKAEEDDRGIRYPMEGTTADGQLVRIVFAPKDSTITVVTVIDLEREAPCNCS